MKALFVFDGAFQDAKTAMCSIITKKERSGESWHLFKKYTTKKPHPEKGLPEDMKPIDRGEAEKHLVSYIGKRSDERWKERWFSYEYPILDGVANDINCIDTNEIKDVIKKGNINYGFIIVRNHNCINDLVKKFEINGQTDVVPVFLYTDYSYIMKGDELNIKKWNKLFEDFLTEKAKNERVQYEDLLIFYGNNNTFETNLEKQLQKLVKIRTNKNEDLFMITGKKGYFLPKDIQSYKTVLENNVAAKPDLFRKRIFIMMKFKNKAPDGDDKKYSIIKEAIEKLSCECVRADDEKCECWFPDAKPDIRYWLSMYLCKYGIALFENDNEGKIVLNPNVIYEMGIMRQQGKRILILIPDNTNIEQVKETDSVEDRERKESLGLFFDLNNEWHNKYKDDEDIKAQVIKFISSLEGRRTEY